MPATQFFLQTARLGFRPWTSEDLSLASAIWENDEVTRFVGGPLNRDQVQEKLRNEIANMGNRGIQYWPMFLLSSGDHVGCAGLRPHGTDRRAFEMGYYLLPAYWRMGLAEEAGRGIVGFAFNHLGARKLIAAHHPHNAASRRVLEKLGFRLTGEKLYPPTGLMHPSYVLEVKGWSSRAIISASP